MVYLIIFSPRILEVANAIWKPRNSIFSIVVLSAIILYWFGIIAYVFFDDDFDAVVKMSAITLRRCIAVIFDSWYKFGLGNFLSEHGRSAIMEEVNGQNQYALNGARMGFDFVFFFTVPTLLLSILSGIIIDNFGERRSKSDTIKERQNDQCFICSKPSITIDQFDNHCRFTHNIWDYMYYIGYLQKMSQSDRTDSRDIHVYECLKKENSSWFPSYQQFVIDQVSKKKEVDILGQVIRESEDKNLSDTNEFEEPKEASENLMDEIATLKTEIYEIEEQNRALNSIINQIESVITQPEQDHD